ncbi:MAG TPA: diguanylate cyclase [candidate division Zixibacteria bacterium]|nr:diguanylate cyclase [candidate division Zixibacteria bacterium]
MLRLARLLAFLAPPALALFLTVGVALVAQADDHRERTAHLLLGGSAVVAGMTSMALFAWSYVGWRLNRIARALEETLEADVPVLLRETGIPAERRLARAFNAAAGAFLQIEARASHDRLTGVANRETLLTSLVAEVERAARHHKWLSVAFIDIDRFKPINDTYGHNSGDAVLRQVAALVSSNIRASDLFGRYGGEEFMLILPETSPDEAVVLAEKLRALVMAQPLVIAGNQRLQVTISIGIAGDVGSQLQVDSLVDRADAAMYAAKSLGRNRTYRYRAVDENAPVRRAPISPEHRAAATAIGRWASDTATEALASVLAPQPHHRGRPSDMIAALATGIALQLGLPEEEIERIRIASLLHDLGKLAVPPAILDKPTTLTDHEWQTIGEHPRIGQVILEQASSLREAIPVVLHHHEHYNGGGYPHGLRGNEIPIGARIVAVADAYHAMIHDRPYKQALSHEAALEELRGNAGTQFDPDVVEVFCAIYADGVPPDGLEEVYRLHQRARGGLEEIDPHAAAAVLSGIPLPAARGHLHHTSAPTPAGRGRRRRSERADDTPRPRPVKEASG